MSKLAVLITSICISTPVILGSLLPMSQLAQTLPVQEAAQATPVVDEKQDLPLERARREVRLLDDMYKTSIVLITEHYVNTDDDLPAGEAFKLLFSAMQAKGWHEVRLIDATGEPLNDENDPKEGFETTAVKEIVGGKAIYDEVVTGKDGKRFLRAATAIPVVMDKCIMCHDNYADLPKGKAIGMVGYKVPIFDPVVAKQMDK